MSGLIADSRTMVEKARVEAQVGEVYLRRVDVVQRGRRLTGCYHTELLVHIQRTNECGECDPVSEQPGPAVQ